MPRPATLRAWRRWWFGRDVERLHPVMQGTRVPRRRLLPGVVVLARVPFELDGPDPTAESLGEGRDKVRPVVVVEVVGDEFVGRPCTSAASRLRHPWAYTEVQDLAAAGLTRKTGIRRREVTLPLDACIEVSGVLAERDLAKVLGE